MLQQADEIAAAKGESRTQQPSGSGGNGNGSRHSSPLKAGAAVASDRDTSRKQKKVTADQVAAAKAAMSAVSFLGGGIPALHRGGKP